MHIALSHAHILDHSLLVKNASKKLLPPNPRGGGGRRLPAGSCAFNDLHLLVDDKINCH